MIVFSTFKNRFLNNTTKGFKMNLSTLQTMLWLMRTMGVALLENVFIFVVFSSTRKTILSARLVSRDRRYQSRAYRDVGYFSP